jgi:hypothetical protein
VVNRTHCIAKLTLFCEKRIVANFADDLIEFIREGRAICREDQAWVAHAQFEGWILQVSERIRTECSSELALEWESLPDSPLENRFNILPADLVPPDSAAWAKFCEAVEVRCRWLGQLPSRISAAPERIQSSALAAGRKEIQLDGKGRAFVDPSRVEELKQIRNDKFDFSKLVRMCEETNICFTGECYLAVAMLTRAILDHIPPVFSADTFAEVANNYCTGTKSFKASMQTLDNSSRKIADQHLHSQIRNAEVLPNATQVDFAPALDVLLGEIVRLYKRT